MIATFTIPGITPSQNIYDRLHWSKKHALRNEWYYTTLSVCGRNDSKAPPAHLTTSRVAKRLLDIPNLAAGQKFLIDALVEYKWLCGDGPQDVLSFTTIQRKAEKGEEQHMIVTIEYN